MVAGRCAGCRLGEHRQRRCTLLCILPVVVAKASQSPYFPFNHHHHMSCILPVASRIPSPVTCLPPTTTTIVNIDHCLAVLCCFAMHRHCCAPRRLRLKSRSPSPCASLCIPGNDPMHIVLHLASLMSAGFPARRRPIGDVPSHHPFVSSQWTNK